MPGNFQFLLFNSLYITERKTFPSNVIEDCTGSGHIRRQPRLVQALFIREFYERTFLRFALESSEILSSLRLLEPLGIWGHNKKLNDVSPAFGDERLARLY
jgi:hypothetical protein